MWGLIKKDLFVIKGNSKTLLVLVAAFLVMELQGNNTFTTILPIMGAMIFLSTFNYDNYNKWDAYACTLPEGRKNVVRSKYIATIIVVICVSILSVILSYAIAQFSDMAKISSTPYELENSLSGMVGSLVAAILIISITYPFIFKYGIENGRMLLFVVLGIVTAVIRGSI